MGCVWVSPGSYVRQNFFIWKYFFKTSQTSDRQPQFRRDTWLLPDGGGFNLTCKSKARFRFPCFCHRTKLMGIQPHALAGNGRRRSMESLYLLGGGGQWQDLNTDSIDPSWLQSSKHILNCRHQGWHHNRAGLEMRLYIGGSAMLIYSADWRTWGVGGVNGSNRGLIYRVNGVRA